MRTPTAISRTPCAPCAERRPGPRSTDAPASTLASTLVDVTFTIRSATGTRFPDVEAILGPKEPGAQGCWCLGYRLGHKVESTLVADQRSAYMAKLCRRRTHAPGVLVYAGHDVVGWAGVAPREEMHEFSTSQRYPNREEPGVWVIWCFRVRAGHGGKCVAQALLGGAVE